MVAGQRYYIELLHKEGGGGDNAAITWNWRSPGVWATPTAGSAPLPGAILEYQEGGTLDGLAHPPANYAPIVQPQTFIVFGGSFTDIELTAEDFEKSPLTFTVIENPTKGTLSGTAPNLVYTPLPGASGMDHFAYIANDGSLNSEPATITFSLIPESSSDIKVWNGFTDTLWDSAGNWTPGVIPDSNDAIVFNGDSLANLATSLNGNRTVSRLVVLDPAGPISVANNTLTLSGGIEMLSAEANLTISSAVALSSAQEWSVGTGRTLLASGSLSGASALTKTGPGTLRFSSAGTQSGGIVVNEGIVEISGGGWYGGNVGGTGMLTVNQGATAINVNSHSFGSSENPNRDITINGGTFLLQAETYADDVWSTGGNFGGSGDLRSRTGNNSIFTINADSEPTVIGCLLNAVGSWNFAVANGAATNDIVINAPFGSGGAITKSGEGRMLVTSTSTHTGTFAVTAGELALTGSLAAGSPVTIQSAATLSGTGNVQGTVTQNGTLSPGMGIAVIQVGALNQSAGATTRITLAGVNPGSGHDQVAVSGTANLAGVLNVTLAPGFIPETGNTFDIITCASRSGTFGAINLPSLPSDRAWATAYNGSGTPGLRLTVEAVAPPEFTLSYIAGANGSISGTTPQTIVQGGTASNVTAVPANGYRFVSWSDGILTAQRADTNIQANLSVTATFAIQQYSVSYIAGANGSITGNTTQTINHGANATSITAVPATGYHFVSWSDGILTAQRADTNIQANLSVTANFAINQYSVNYAAGANGSIAGNTAQTIDHGANATSVTAVPITGYHFVSWSDGILTAERTDTNIQANLNVTATFAINQYAVNYAAGANGSITGNTAQTIDHGANATSVTAVPASGYHFVSWSDGVLTAQRTDTNIQANLSVTASFGMEPYAAWMASFPTITEPADQVPGADPDQDGLANSIEFVVGSNPSLPNGGVLNATHHGTHLTFQFDRVKAAGEAGFSSVVELADQNLGNWSAAPPEMVQIVDHGTTETVTVTVPAGSPQGKFARLRVSTP